MSISLVHHGAQNYRKIALAHFLFPRHKKRNAPGNLAGIFTSFAKDFMR